MRNDELDEAQVRTLKALASPVRLRVLELLKDPAGNFPPQVDGDLVEDGVCSDWIKDELGLAASTTSRHLGLLADAGLLQVTRRRGWSFYRRDEAAIKRFTQEMQKGL